MALIRWEPVRELQTVQNEMNRLFNTFFDSPTPSGNGGTALRRWIPAMDVVETDDQYVLRADLPGMSESDVNVELDDNVLTISGERKSETEQRSKGVYRVHGRDPASQPGPAVAARGRRVEERVEQPVHLILDRLELANGLPANQCHYKPPLGD